MPRWVLLCRETTFIKFVLVISIICLVWTYSSPPSTFSTRRMSTNGVTRYIHGNSFPTLIWRLYFPPFSILRIPVVLWLVCKRKWTRSFLLGICTVYVAGGSQSSTWLLLKLGIHGRRFQFRIRRTIDNEHGIWEGYGRSELWKEWTVSLPPLLCTI